MRCLVTGASGHLGSYLTRHLLDHGEEVIILARPESDLWRLEGVLDRVKMIRVDLSKIATTAEEIHRVAPETVFHCAWSGVTRNTRNRPEQFAPNIIGALQLFEVTRAVGCQCWVGIGSQAEYGRQSQVLREDLVPRPDTAYGMAKLCLGQVLQTLCELSNIRYVWLRLLATYGPKDNPEHLIPSVICKLLARVGPSLTRGEQIWDYLFIEDAVEAIRLVACNPGVKGTYNLASGNGYSVREIAMRLRDMVDPALPLGFGETMEGPGKALDLRADVTRLHRAIDWRPRVDLETGLTETFDWYRNQGKT